MIPLAAPARMRGARRLKVFGNTRPVRSMPDREGPIATPETPDGSDGSDDAREHRTIFTKKIKRI